MIELAVLVWMSSEKRTSQEGVPYCRIRWGLLNEDGDVETLLYTNEGADFDNPSVRRRWGALSKVAGLTVRARPDHSKLDEMMAGRVLPVELYSEDGQKNFDVRRYIYWEDVEPERMIAAEAYADKKKRSGPC